MALAHAIGNKVEATYRRGDLFNKRRKIMEAWTEYCNTPAVKSKNNVIEMGLKPVFLLVCQVEQLKFYFLRQIMVATVSRV